MGKISESQITTEVMATGGHQIQDKIPRKGQGAGKFNHAASTTTTKKSPRKGN